MHKWLAQVQWREMAAIGRGRVHEAVWVALRAQWKCDGPGYGCCWVAEGMQITTVSPVAGGEKSAESANCLPEWLATLNYHRSTGTVQYFKL